MTARDQSVYRRRRRTAGAALIALAAIVGLGIEAAAGDSAVGPAPQRIEQDAIDAIPDRVLLGQRLMVRMEGEATDGLIRQARRGAIGGVILFPPPDQGTGSLKREVRRLQRASGDRPLLFVAIDQEGGEIKRLPGGPPDRSPAELAAPGDERAARTEGRKTGRFLSRLGINVDLAPVLDVPSSELSFIATRSFGTNARAVAGNGVAFAEGLEAAGVIPAVKHFPGLGRAIANTDLSPSEIDAPRGQLDADLAPFREAVEREVPMVMVGHAIYRALDRELPAALSSMVVGELLRDELTYDGVVISDDLGAAAVADVADERQAAVAAARAGIDVLLLAKTSDGEPALNALRAALQDDELSRADLESSWLRIVDLKESIGG